MSWARDGFYYSRFSKPNDGGELDDSNENSQIYYHKLGTNQIDDKLIYSDLKNPKISNYISTTNDEKYLLLYRSKGTSGNALYISTINDSTTEFKPIIENYNFDHNVIGNIGSTFFLLTNYNAKNWRLVKFEYNNPEPQYWINVITESENPLNSVSIVDGKLLVNYSVNVSSRLFVYSIDGKLETEVVLPTMGTAYGFGGEKEDLEVFYTFTSFAYPPTVFRYNVKEVSFLQITDILGNVVKNIEIEGIGVKTIYLGELHKGLYFGNLVQNGEILKINKLIINK